jgi:hypothetical protein
MKEIGERELRKILN